MKKAIFGLIALLLLATLVVAGKPIKVERNLCAVYYNRTINYDGQYGILNYNHKRVSVEGWELRPNTGYTLVKMPYNKTAYDTTCIDQSVSDSSGYIKVSGSSIPFIGTYVLALSSDFDCNRHSWLANPWGAENYLYATC